MRGSRLLGTIRDGGTLSQPRPNETRRKAFLGIAVIFTALNLRPTIAAISPVLSQIRRTTGLTDAGAGLLTTLPLVCFGLLAPAAPRLVRRFGTGLVLLSCVGLLTAGTVVRSIGIAGLFAGTVMLGIGIAVANVLMPGIVKDDFPEHVGLMTGLYTMALSAGPAVAVGISAPLSTGLGGNWRLATALWAAPALVAFLLLVPLRAHRRPAGMRASPAAGRLLRDPTAWAITLFMGLQSLEFYSVLAWLPTIFSSRGISPDGAGGLLAVTNVVGILSAMAAPTVAQRLPSARTAVLGCVSFLAAGTGGLLAAPHSLYLLWAILLGVGQGSAISLALLLMVLRSHSAHQAMALSGMAQGIGYLIASAGPATTGALHQASHSWSLPLGVLLAVLLPLGLAGYVAGGNRKVSREEVHVALEESGSLGAR